MTPCGLQGSDAARRMVLAWPPAKFSETERKRRRFERVYGEGLSTS